MRESSAIALLEDRSFDRLPGKRVEILIHAEREIERSKRLGGGELTRGIARFAGCDPRWNRFEECCHEKIGPFLFARDGQRTLVRANPVAPVLIVKFGFWSAAPPSLGEGTAGITLSLCSLQCYRSAIPLADTLPVIAQVLNPLRNSGLFRTARDLCARAVGIALELHRNFSVARSIPTARSQVRRLSRNVPYRFRCRSRWHPRSAFGACVRLVGAFSLGARIGRGKCEGGWFRRPRCEPALAWTAAFQWEPPPWAHVALIFERCNESGLTSAATRSRKF